MRIKLEFELDELNLKRAEYFFDIYEPVRAIYDMPNKFFLGSREDWAFQLIASLLRCMSKPTSTPRTNPPAKSYIRSARTFPQNFSIPKNFTLT